MIKIAICDDEKYIVDDISVRIMDYFNNDKEKYELFDFSNSADFISFYDEEGKADIIMMDIEVGDCNGVDIISKIRHIDKNVLVLFITSHTSYVCNAFTVGAFQYILKPIDEKVFNSELHRAVQHVYSNKKILRVEKLGTNLFVDVTFITYIESINKNILIHMNNKKTIETTKQLSNIYEDLSCHNFCQSHRSFIVNLQTVFSVDFNEIRLINGDVVPVSRKYREEFKSKLNTYINKVKL